MSSRCCRSVPVFGKMRSGVVVPTTMKSTSEGVAPADFSARRAACSASEELDSSGPAMWRRSMPVRVRIHSSVVSTVFSRSLLVTTFSGR
jgi:hypothetical protein